MPPKTAKDKGTEAEIKVAAAYRHWGIDPKATRMPRSGGIDHLKSDIRKPNDYQYADEVKCQEKVRLWQWWDQARSQVSLGRIPILHITADFRPILTVMDIKTYMDLRKTIKDLEERIKELEA